MLTSKSFPTRSGVRVIITDTEQCEICHRSADDCQLNPWPNHDFEPRTWRADQLPHWLRARVDEPPTKETSCPEPADAPQQLPMLHVIRGQN